MTVAAKLPPLRRVDWHPKAGLPNPEQWIREGNLCGAAGFKEQSSWEVEAESIPSQRRDATYIGSPGRRDSLQTAGRAVPWCVARNRKGPVGFIQQSPRETFCFPERHSTEPQEASKLRSRGGEEGPPTSRESRKLPSKQAWCLFVSLHVLDFWTPPNGTH